MKRVLFRLDAGSTIGSGHLRRSLALAREMKLRGAYCIFMLKSRDLALGDFLTKDACDTWSIISPECSLEQDMLEIGRIHKDNTIDMVIVDHHEVDDVYQQQLQAMGLKWLQFATTKIKDPCSTWVLNTSPSAIAVDDPKFFCGPSYAWVRPEFRAMRKKYVIAKNIRNILLTFGGGNDRGAIQFSLEAIKDLYPNAVRYIYTTSLNPNKNYIRDYINECADSRLKLICDTTSLAEPMSQADMAITAGGTTVFELAAIGVPSIIVSIADNQYAIATAWDAADIAINAGPLKDLETKDLRQHVQRLGDDCELRKSMFTAARKCVDGLGAIRLAERLLA